jgi:hypothetical protein
MIPSPIKNKLKPASAPTEKRNILGIAKSQNISLRSKIFAADGGLRENIHKTMHTKCSTKTHSINRKPQGKKRHPLFAFN